MNIEFESYQYEEGKTRILAYYDDRLVGNLDYTPSTDANLPVKLGLVFVNYNYWKRGIGRALLGEFVNAVGHGNMITSPITHTGTIRTLNDKIPDTDTDRIQRLILTTENELHNLPIVKVLNSSGISVNRVHVIYNSKEVRLRSGTVIYAASLKGTT